MVGDKDGDKGASVSTGSLPCMNWLKVALAQNLLVRQENEGLFSRKLIHYRKEFYRYLQGRR